jgi:CubicO group peptidase (beta-lactamase class C family)
MDQGRLQARLAELCEQLVVPGAAVAVLRDGVVTSATTGIANVGTGLLVQDDTLFAAGSITKVFTASLLMSCVDDGLVDLEETVVHYLPDFVLGDGRRSSRITVRMLLDHTGGLPTNFMPAQPKGPSVIAEFIRMLDRFQVVGEPGERWSYSNAGTVTAGAIVERVTGLTYDEALEERILRPLGLNATTDTDRMILGSTAVGHMVDPGSTVAVRADLFQMCPGMGPAGSTLFCDAHALIAFAQMHLSGGVAPDGAQVLSAAATKLMRTPSVSTSWGFETDQFGLGWGIRSTPVGPLVGHSGANIAMHATLETLPDQQGAIAVMANSTNGMALYRVLSHEILEECFGVAPFEGPTPPQTPVTMDLEPYVGRYEAPHGALEVEVREGQLHLTIQPEEELDKWYRMMRQAPPTELILAATGHPERFLAQAPGVWSWMPVEFLDVERGGGPTLLRFAAMYERV